MQVDGKTISLSDFTARSGSAIVTLRPSYLEKLSVGNHTVSAVFDDAPSATANFTVVAANTPTVTPTSGTTATTQGTTSTTATDTAKGDALPKTGDGASLFAWSAVVAAAIIVLIGAIALRKRANSGRSKR